MECCCSAPPSTGTAELVTSKQTSERYNAGQDPAEQIFAEDAGDDIIVEEAAAVAQASPDLSFMAWFSRPRISDRLGITADIANENVLHVCLVDPAGGACVGRWNDSVPEGQKIRVGDYITEINGLSVATVDQSDGVKVSEALRDQLRTATALLLKVVRPRIWECTVVKTKQGLGCKLDFSEKSVSLVITGFTGDGPARAPGLAELTIGDRIVGVGGMEGAAAELLRALQAVEDSVVLKMSRPALQEAQGSSFVLKSRPAV